ncbi:MAG: hypothetical protein V4631_08370 [Pseudomonadota bacterium]
MFVFTPSLPSAFSARFGTRLPLSLARAFAAMVWGGFYIFNVRHLRSTIFPCVRAATGQGAAGSYLVGLGGAIAFGRYLSDFAFFLYRPASVIARRVRHKTGFRHTANLTDALKDGKGAILVLSNFSSFYYTLTAPRENILPDNREVVIVQPSYSVSSEESKRFRQKISGVIGRDLQIIESGTLRAGIEMTAALKRGAIVGCLVDFFPPNATSLAMTEFLGHPSCQPTGIGAIAAKNNVAVVPCFTYFEEGKYITEFAPAIVAPADGDMPDKVLSLCTRIDASLSAAIMARPAQWASWISVPHKWQTASAMLAQMEEQE